MSTQDKKLRYNFTCRDVNVLEQTFITCRLIFIQPTGADTQQVVLSTAADTHSQCRWKKQSIVDLISGWTSFGQKLPVDPTWTPLRDEFGPLLLTELFQVVWCERFPRVLPTELLSFDWTKPKGVVLFLLRCFRSSSWLRNSTSRDRQLVEKRFNSFPVRRCCTFLMSGVVLCFLTSCLV